MDLIGNSAVTIRDYGTIVHKRKLVLERTQHSRTTCQEGGSNNDAGTVNRADYGTIVHKHKLVLELTQGGFPTNCPLQWLALYGYLRFSWEEKLVAPLIAAPMEK